MKRVTIGALPQEPLAAAARFYEAWLVEVEAVLTAGEDVMAILEPADHAHREWRRAVAAALARAHAPHRLNLVAGEGAAIDAAETFLAAAPGITGQYLECDGADAG